MAVAFDAVSTGVARNAGTTLTDSITTGAISNGFLLIEIGHAVSATNRALHVTVDGVPAGRIGWRGDNDISGGDHIVEMWGFIDPPASSTLSVVATMLGTNNDAVMKCRSYSGVHQGKPYRSAKTDQSGSISSTPSITIDSATGDLAVATIYHDHTDVWTADASVTQRYEQNPISNDGGLIGLEGPCVTWST